MIVYNKILRVSICALFMITVPLFSQSQEETKTTVPDSTQNQIEQPPPVDDNAIKLFLDKIEVTGQLEKPQAVFIIPGKSPEIDDIRIERSFFNDIFRTVEKRGRAVSKEHKEFKKNRKDYIPW